mmetsp:Transcript_25526/g.65734  ORF Transcript_25526/g.65734 Transcript_25526/m.65734 type:complete len:247 (-) Transcript_25526:100-840(-)
MRPATEMMAGFLSGISSPAGRGALLMSKNAAIFSASSVADEMTIRSSGRFFWTFFRSPSRMSVAMLRSWASSIMITLYWGRSGFSDISRIRTPSVRNFMRVRSFDVLSSKRIVYPTVSPRAHPASSATLLETVMTGTRRGCVMAICRPPAVQPASCKNCGSCVVFPLPVSPSTTTVACFSTRYSSAVRSSAMGSRRRCSSTPKWVSRSASTAGLGSCCSLLSLSTSNFTPKEAADVLPGRRNAMLY